jgi:tyrosyl-tRNA synthetase
MVLHIGRTIFFAFLGIFLYPKHMEKIIIDPKKIDEIVSRSIAEILPSKNGFKSLLLSGKKFRIYVGADATASQLHLGNATNFIILERLRRLGHEVIVLFGDFTAMIGDPTDKNATRKPLTKDQVDKNIETWKEQLSPIIDFNDKNNPAKIARNSEWLSKLNFAEISKLMSYFTVQRIMERDMFEKRMKEKKPILIQEFLYPIMQGYDSVHLDVDVEIGGTDQTFNMLAGRTLQRKIHNKEKFVISTTLLENPVTGKKLMSKSEGNFIGLNDLPQDMFGKIMSLPDETIVQMFVDCTFVEMSEIEKMETELKNNQLNPKDAKMNLAFEICKIYHGEEEAKSAQNYFENVFSKNKLNEAEISELELASGKYILKDLLVELKLVASKSESSRLIEQKAVEINGELKIDPRELIEIRGGEIVKVGKYRLAKIKTS